MAKTKYQRFEYSITASGQLIDSQNLSFENNTKRILAVSVESSLPNQAYYRGSQRLEINSDELLPTGTETRRLMSNQSVAPDARAFQLGEVDPGNKKLRIAYQDTNHPSAVFAAYKVTYIFKTIVA